MLLQGRNEGRASPNKRSNRLQRRGHFLVLSVSQLDGHGARWSFRFKRLPGLPATARYLSLLGFRVFKLAHSFVRARSEFT